MSTRLFNGGLNTRAAPHLIAKHEAVEFSNIDNSRGTLKAVYDKADSGVSLDPYAHYFAEQSAWVASATARHYLEYQNFLYYTEPSAVPKYTDDTTEWLLGILKPASAMAPPSIGAAGVLTGTYTYVFTYYNSALGVESQPSAVSTEVTPASDSIDLTIIPVSSDPQVDKKRIYRVGGALTSFSLVATIDNATTTYNDDIADVDVPGDDMVATDYRQAASSTKYLTEAFGMLFGAVGDKLYYTQPGRFTAWPATYFVDLPATITGIAYHGSLGVLVMTKYKTYRLLGSSHTTFSLQVLSHDQGCLTFDSVQQFKNTVVWASSDGLCAPTGSAVKVLTKDKLGKLDLTVLNSAFHDETYYAVLSTGELLAFDFRFGTVLKNLSLGVTRLAVAEDVLYGYATDTYYKLFEGVNQLSFAFTSAEMTDGSLLQRKKYKSVFVSLTGTVQIQVYVSGVLVITKSLTDGEPHELKIPEEHKNGYKIQFRLTGAGEVFELDYSVVGDSRG